MKLDVYLIIGLTKESRHWSAEFLEGLRNTLKPESIQFVDLPGSGKFLGDKSPMTMEEIVSTARSQLTFNPDHQRVIVAISLGGMSAWSWVTQYPDDFTHMVMVNASIGSLSPFWKRAQPSAMIEFFRIAMASKGKQKERRIIDLCVNNRPNGDRIYPSWVEIGEKATMSFSNTLSQLIAAMRFRPKKTPLIPMLVLAAKHDRIAHYSCSEAIAKHASPNTKVKLVLNEDPLVGHGFHVDSPEELVRNIHEFMQEFVTSKA